MAPEYKPLASNHIRIIILKPAENPNADLQFSFHQASLDDLEDDYEAISYCWGKDGQKCTLYTESLATFTVTKNLGLALERFRLKNDTRRLWADAVCINQNDIKEKETQIPLMVNIFRGARRVLAWLGPGGNGEEDVMRELARTSRDGSHPWPYIPNLQAVLGMEWFNRMWIIQEVVFNTDVTFFAGKAEISWIRLCIALDDGRQGVEHLLDKISPEVVRKVDAVKTMHNLWMRNFRITADSRVNPRINTSIPLDEERGIFHLMNTFAYYGCTDPRDRIYAVYSMASRIRPYKPDPESRILDLVITMPVDYSLDLMKTYRTLVLGAIDAGYLPNILESLFARTMTRGPEWPSWVPDWTTPPTISPSPKNFGDSIGRISIDGNTLNLNLSILHEHEPDAETDHIFHPIVAKRPTYDGINVRGIDSDGDFIEAVKRFDSGRGFAHIIVPDHVAVVALETHVGYHVGWNQRIKKRLPRTMKGRCVFRARYRFYEDLFGVGSAELQVGDSILIGSSDKERKDDVEDVSAALILRKSEGDYSQAGWRLVGDAFVIRDRGMTFRRGEWSKTNIKISLV